MAVIFGCLFVIGSILAGFTMAGGKVAALIHLSEIITICGAFWLPLKSGDSLLLTLTGFVSILFGIVMFAKPGAGALALLALIAAYALIFGFIELTVAIGGESLLKRSLRSVTATNKPQTS